MNTSSPLMIFESKKSKNYWKSYTCNLEAWWLVSVRSLSCCLFSFCLLRSVYPMSTYIQANISDTINLMIEAAVVTIFKIPATFQNHLIRVQLNIFIFPHTNFIISPTFTYPRPMSTSLPIQICALSSLWSSSILTCATHMFLGMVFSRPWWTNHGPHS